MFDRSPLLSPFSFPLSMFVLQKILFGGALLFKNSTPANLLHARFCSFYAITMGKLLAKFQAESH